MLGRVASRHGRGEVEAAVALNQAVQVLVLCLLNKARKEQSYCKGMAINCTFRVRRVGLWLQGCPSKKSNSHMVKLTSYVVFGDMLLQRFPLMLTQVMPRLLVSFLPIQYKSPPRDNKHPILSVRYSDKFSCSNSKGYQRRTQLITYHRFVGVNPCDDGLEPLVLLPLPEV